jgi:hypothetical protein
MTASITANAGTAADGADGERGAGGAERAGQAVIETMGMKTIAEKISIVQEIACQTNSCHER